MRTFSHRVAPIALLVAALMLAAPAAAARSRRDRTTTAGGRAATRSRSASATCPTSRTPPRSSGCRTRRSQNDVGSNVDLKTSTYNSGTDETTALLAGALDAAFVGPNPAINAYQKSNGTLDPHRLRRRVGRRVPRREAVDHERRRPQGQEARDAVARQHPGRRAAHLAEAEGLQDHTDGGGDVSIVPQDNSDDGHRVPDRRDRRCLGARAVRDQARSRKAARSSSTRRPCGRSGKFVTTNLVVTTKFLADHPDVVTNLLKGLDSSIDLIKSDPTQARAARVGRHRRRSTGKAPDDLADRDVVQEHHVHARPDRLVAARPTPRTPKALGFIDSTDLKNIYDLTLLNKMLTGAGQGGDHAVKPSL